MLCTGGYVNVFYLSTNAMGCSVTAIWKAHKKGAYFANPCFTQIHPTCIPQAGDYQSKLTLMSESLRNDGRIWVPKKKEDSGKPANQIPEEDRDYYLERKYPTFGNLAPRDIASRAAKEACDDARGVGPGGRGVYLDFADSIKRLGENVIRERYGNLFEMYERITDENGYKQPMRIYPAPHYAMGGLWVDYNLMSNLPGLFVLGEANFSVHGANRLGASALMQGLADGYFVIPYTIGGYLAGAKPGKVKADRSGVREVDRGGEGVLGEAPRDERQADGDRVHPRARHAHVEQRRDGAQRAVAQRRPQEDPRHPRGVPQEREGDRHGRGAEPAARERRPDGRLPRVRRAAHARRAAPERVVRRSLPRRAPVPGRRGEARRRELRLRGRVGVQGSEQGARASQGAAQVRERPPRGEELQVMSAHETGHETMNLKLIVWRQAGPNQPGKFEHYDAKNITPHHSFLEMLDVVNEELIKDGQGADRLRSRLPRGDLRDLLRRRERRPARRAEAHHALPAAHAEVQGR